MLFDMNGTYTAGSKSTFASIRYFNMTEGNNYIDLKAWDVSNNRSCNRSTNISGTTNTYRLNILHTIQNLTDPIEYEQAWDVWQYCDETTYQWYKDRFMHESTLMKHIISNYTDVVAWFHGHVHIDPNEFADGLGSCVSGAGRANLPGHVHFIYCGDIWWEHGPAARESNGISWIHPVAIMALVFCVIGFIVSMIRRIVDKK